MNSYGIIVGHKIRQLRKQKKLSMKQLGKLVNLHESTVSRYEKGEISTLDIEKLKEFAKALSISTDYLIGWDNQNSLTLEEISNILKVSRNTYYCYEKGTRACPIELFINICSFYRDDYLNVFKEINEKTVSLVERKRIINEQI